MKRGELDFIRQMNELEIQKAKELGEIEACTSLCVEGDVECSVLLIHDCVWCGVVWRGVAWRGVVCDTSFIICLLRLSSNQPILQLAQVSKFAAHVEAIGAKTIQAVATSGPESQASHTGQEWK